MPSSARRLLDRLDAVAQGVTRGDVGPHGHHPLTVQAVDACEPVHAERSRPRCPSGSAASRSRQWPPPAVAAWPRFGPSRRRADALVRTYSCEIASGLPRSTPTNRSSTSYTSPQTGLASGWLGRRRPRRSASVPAISSTSTPSEAARSRSISTCSSGFRLQRVVGVHDAGDPAPWRALHRRAAAAEVGQFIQIRAGDREIDIDRGALAKRRQVADRTVQVQFRKRWRRVSIPRTSCIFSRWVKFPSKAPPRPPGHGRATVGPRRTFAFSQVLQTHVDHAGIDARQAAEPRLVNSSLTPGNVAQLGLDRSHQLVHRPQRGPFAGHDFDFELRLVHVRRDVVLFDQLVQRPVGCDHGQRQQQHDPAPAKRPAQHGQVRRPRSSDRSPRATPARPPWSSAAARQQPQHIIGVSVKLTSSETRIATVAVIAELEQHPPGDAGQERHRQEHDHQRQAS